MCRRARAEENHSNRPYPIPNMQELLNEVGGAKMVSSPDMVAGYHQVKIRDQDKEKTAFLRAMDFTSIINYLPDSSMQSLHSGDSWNMSLRTCCSRLHSSILTTYWFYLRTERITCYTLKLSHGVRNSTYNWISTNVDSSRRRWIFSGFRMNNGELHVTETQKDKIRKVKSPTNVSETRSLLGYKHSSVSSSLSSLKDETLAGAPQEG